MARQDNSIITYDDAIYMHNNEGFNKFKLIPSSKECMTKSNVLEYLDIEIGKLDTLQTNQLVTYNRLSLPFYPFLRSYWGLGELSGNFIDISGAPKDLVPSAEVTRSAAGVIGNASGFANGAGTVGNNTHYDFSISQVDKSVAIQAWVKFTSDSDGRIYTQEVTASRWNVRLWYTASTSELSFTLRGESETAGGYIGRAISNFDIKLNQWQHIVMTYDATKLNSGIRLYQNGIRKDDIDKSSGTYGSYAAVSTTSINIGVFPGNLDEVFFLRDYYLDAFDINYLYNSGNGRIIYNQNI